MDVEEGDEVRRPLAIDLCCGLGGWTEGLLAEGWDVVGFDIERHRYGAHQYPAQLVLQDILTLDGRQFRSVASLIVASPPCQRYSYMAMPWSRAKALIAWHREDGHPERIVELNALFNACLRIGREAGCPIVIENVRGAIPWVGRSRWNYGSFHLWGDVPALMPITFRRSVMKSGVTHRAGTNFHRKTPAGSWDPTRANFVQGTKEWVEEWVDDSIKVGDVGWRRDNDIHPVGFNVMATRQMLADDSVKVGGSAGDDWFTHHNRPEFDRRAGLTVPVECEGCGTSVVMSSWTIEADLNEFGRAHSGCIGSKVIVGRAEIREHGGTDGTEDLRGLCSDGAVATQMLRSEGLRLSGVSGSGPVVPDVSRRTSELEIAGRDGLKVPSRDGRRTDPGNGARFTSDEDRATKNSGGSWFNVAHNTESGKGQNPDGRKVTGDWFGDYAAMKESGTISPGRMHGKGSQARKAASARIAKIPLALARHIARVYHP